MTIEVTALFVKETAASLLDAGLDLAQAIGLPVTSWRTGDPTKTLFKHLAEVLAARDEVAAEYCKAGFLSTAEGDWLTVLALEVYGVTRTESSPATPTIVLHNGGGGVYDAEPGDWSFKASSSDATFHNTNTVHLVGGADATVELIADTEGSEGSVATDEVDLLLTTLLGCTISSSTASIGLDEQDDDSLRADCTDTLGALSPDGPPDAYEFVARQETLTGVDTITRSRSSEDSATGLVTVWVAGPDGGVDAPSVAAAQAAVEQWATPLCITPTVVSATAMTVNVTATITGDDIPADFLTTIELALATHLSSHPIANDSGGVVSRGLLFGVLARALDLTNAAITVPAADVAYTAGQVPVIGTVSVTEV